MPTLQYVKGNPVQNAQEYRLYRGSIDTDGKFKPLNGDGFVESMYINRQLAIKGAISDKGDPATIPWEAGMNQVIQVLPLTKCTEDGYVYYITVEGQIEVTITEGDRFRFIDFKGTYYFPNGYFESPSMVQPISFKIEGIGTYNAANPEDRKDEYGNIVDGLIKLDIAYGKGTVPTNHGTITISNYGKYTFYSAALEYPPTVYGGYNQYRCSDIVPVADLTDNLMEEMTTDADEPVFSCVGPFSEPEGGMPGYKVAFYSAPIQSSFYFLGGYRFSTNGGDWTFGSRYLNVNDITNMAAAVKNATGKDAPYVMFCSSPTNTGKGDDVDFISLGKILFLLNGKNLEADDVLAVKAIGDGTFFSDSDFGYKDENGQIAIFQPVS